jgi:predicted secreted hydrolase
LRRALLALTALLIVTACSTGPRYEPRSTPVPTAAPPSPTAMVPVTFPRDDAPHDQLTEWWYYTGHLDAGSGQSYGFELVVFQSVRGNGPVGYAAHYAITDLARGKFAFDQRTSIGSQIGRNDGFDLTVGDWRMRGANGQDHLTANMPGYAIDLALASTKPAALHNGVGLISFGPAGDSYYYSRTNMKVTGTLMVDGRAERVTGRAWMDHQWGNFISAGGGWDWFSIQLDDDTELTGSLVRDDAGRVVFSYGTYVDAEGATTHLGANEFTADGSAPWQSSATGASYPTRWRVRGERPRLELHLTAALPNQELDTRPTTGVAYWEGAVKVAGTKDGRPIAGRGYVELTGRQPPAR